MTIAEALRRGRLFRVGPGGAKPARNRAVRPAASPGRQADSGSEDSPSLRDWVGVLAMGTGLFLAIMDVQIVTSSLTQIQGGLSASTDEIAWVQTAYLIADVVMVPMSGFMARMLSTRVLFVIAALGFTAASVLCATATSLGEMIIYRAMQGFCGGAITPTVWPVVYTRFRGRQLARVIAIISVILSLASTLGPTLGGFLTNTFSWHWLFLVNIVPGLAVAAVVWATIDIDKPDLSLLRHFDLTGMLLMAAFLGCLEYALHEGPRWDWFDDETIRVAVLVSIVGGALFFWRVLTYHLPIVDLRAFLNRNFALGTFFTFTIGVGMYGTTYLVPLFLAQVRGYNALEIGLTIIVTGLVTMAMSPLSTGIARLLDLRVMLAVGFGLFGLSMYLTATLTNQTGFWELFVPLAARGLGLICCYLPANMIAMGTLPTDGLKNAAALQPHSRSRRRHRPGRDCYADEREGAFPLEPPDREHQPGSSRGAAVSRRRSQPP
jgi:DHA2 family multidrug resistance protein